MIVLMCACSAWGWRAKRTRGSNEAKKARLAGEKVCVPAPSGYAQRVPAEEGPER